MPDFVLKICVAGDGGVGKTTLLERYVNNVFSSNTKMTIGAGIYSKKLDLPNLKLKDDRQVFFQVWDFAGEERFRFLLGPYLKGAHGILMCFDLTRFKTFSNLEDWYEEIIKTNLNEKTQVLYLIGTKKDLEDKRALSADVVKSFMEDKKIGRYFESSSKNGDNIEEIFTNLGIDILKKNKLIQE